MSPQSFAAADFMEKAKISESTIRRMSHYYRFLEEMEEEGLETISSKKLAARGHLNPAKVRKDLSYFGSFGRRGKGYDIKLLKQAIHDILGVTRKWRLILIGAGNLGSALFYFGEFKKAGFEILAVLEKDPAKIGQEWHGIMICSVDDLEEVVRSFQIDIAVLAVPAKAAVEVAERLVRAGVKALLNFAPIKLPYQRGIIIRDVNLAMELEGLTYLLKNGQAPEFRADDNILSS